MRKVCRYGREASQGREPSSLPLEEATRVNERWSMDFVTDSLAGGSRFRAFKVVDQYSRECVALKAGVSLRSVDISAVLEAAIEERGKPVALTCDHGTEFTSRFFDSWAYFQGIALDFIRPGKPVENAYIESFNGRLREECLSQSWFTDLADAESALAAWQTDYNESRPHTSLGGLTPAEYVAELLAEGVFKQAS